MKFAIPLIEERMLSAHFALCDMFAFYIVEENEIKDREIGIPPHCNPGSIPKWLQQREVGVVFAAGIGQKAIQLLEEEGIEVICGVESVDSEELIKRYLAGDLKSGKNTCDCMFQSK